MEQNQRVVTNTQRFLRNLCDNYFKKSIPEKWLAYSFPALHYQNDTHRNFAHFLYDWAQNPKGVIVIAGQTSGIGKTLFAVLTYREAFVNLMAQEMHGKYKLDPNKEYDFDKDNEAITMANLLKDKMKDMPQSFYKEWDIYNVILQGYDDKRFNEQEVINRLSQIQPILVIDDLFSNRQNELSRRIALGIIDQRIDWFGLPTIITTNLSPKQISGIDTRIISRLANSYYEMPHQYDYRIEQKGK